MSLDFAHEFIDCSLLLHNCLIDHVSTRKPRSYSEAEAQTVWDELLYYCSRAGSSINSAIASNISVVYAKRDIMIKIVKIMKRTEI